MNAGLHTCTRNRVRDILSNFLYILTDKCLVQSAVRISFINDTYLFPFVWVVVFLDLFRFALLGHVKLENGRKWHVNPFKFVILSKKLVLNHAKSESSNSVRFLLQNIKTHTESNLSSTLKFAQSIVFSLTIYFGPIPHQWALSRVGKCIMFPLTDTRRESSTLIVLRSKSMCHFCSATKGQGLVGRNVNCCISSRGDQI